MPISMRARHEDALHFNICCRGHCHFTVLHSRLPELLGGVQDQLRLRVLRDEVHPRPGHLLVGYLDVRDELEHRTLGLLRKDDCFCAGVCTGAPLEGYC